jgi:hypothetical protein
MSFEKNFYQFPFTPPSLVRRIGPSSRPTTYVLAPGSGLTQASALSTKTTEVPSPGVAPSAASTTGFAGRVSVVTVSMATASGIVAPSPCAPAKLSSLSQLQRL